MSYVDMTLTALIVQVVAEACRLATRWLRARANRYPDLPPTGPTPSPPGPQAPRPPEDQ